MKDRLAFPRERPAGYSFVPVEPGMDGTTT